MIEHTVHMDKLDVPDDDPVNRPKHYLAGGLEAIQVIEAFRLNYRLGKVKNQPPDLTAGEFNRREC